LDGVWHPGLSPASDQPYPGPALRLTRAGRRQDTNGEQMFLKWPDRLGRRELVRREMSRSPGHAQLLVRPEPALSSSLRLHTGGHGAYRHSLSHSTNRNKIYQSLNCARLHSGGKQ
jgi:hypothetical protein